MASKIRLGICGYGNLGKGAESEITRRPDMELAAIFTRRTPPESVRVRSGVPVVHVDDAAQWADKLDVMLLCGGSATDLPVQGPDMAKRFNTVDSFDTHANIPDYLNAVDAAARAGGHVSIVSVGWDPGLFSLFRLYMGAVIPDGQTTTFWGKGVSQGHSDAIRRIDGVRDAIQYTLPSEAAIDRARRGEGAALSVREKHTRLCYVAVHEGADTARIEREIKDMPNYFAGYDATVHFISPEELRANHSQLPHGGNVIHIGQTGGSNRQAMELSLNLGSNPEFTASVLLTCARAAYRLSAKGETGAKTILDIPPILLAEREPEAVIRELL